MVGMGSINPQKTRKSVALDPHAYIQQEERAEPRELCTFRPRLVLDTAMIEVIIKGVSAHKFSNKPLFPSTYVCMYVCRKYVCMYVCMYVGPTV